MTKDFDLQLEEDDLAKSLSLYIERRFAKLQYSAEAILDYIEQYEKILDKTTFNNLLVQASKLYAESKYIRPAFKALGYFAHRITTPFLNCGERFDQTMLLDISKNYT